MKLLLLFHLFLLLIMAYGCHLENAKDADIEFIPGTYIRFSEHEFGTEYDTLIITLQNPSAAQYRILRKWKYERVLDGHAIEPEYKRTATTAIYNPAKKILEETQRGDIYTFDLRKQILFSGPIKYNKL